MLTFGACVMNRTKRIQKVGVHDSRICRRVFGTYIPFRPRFRLLTRGKLQLINPFRRYAVIIVNDIRNGHPSLGIRATLRVPNVYKKIKGVGGRLYTKCIQIDNRPVE